MHMVLFSGAGDYENPFSDIVMKIIHKIIFQFSIFSVSTSHRSTFTKITYHHHPFAIFQLDSLISD